MKKMMGDEAERERANECNWKYVGLRIVRY
jgi:hypothetical protein